MALREAWGKLQELLGRILDPAFWAGLRETETPSLFLLRQYAISFMMHALDSSLLTVGFVVLGRQGKGHLAAAFVGYAVFNVFWLFLEGVLTTFDALDYTEKKTMSSRMRVIRASLAALVVCGALSSLAFFFANQVLHPLLQVPLHVAVKANQHLIMLIPNLFLLGIQKVATKQLLYKRAYKPLLEALAVGAIVNAVLIALLVYAFGLGFISCAISIDVSRFFVLVTLYFRTRTLDVKANVIVEVKKDVQDVYDVLSDTVGLYIGKVRRKPSLSNSDDIGSSSNKISKSNSDRSDISYSEVSQDSSVKVTGEDDDGLELVDLIEHPDGKFRPQFVDPEEDSRPLVQKSSSNVGKSRKSKGDRGKLDEVKSGVLATLRSIMVKYGKSARTTLKFAFVGVPTGLLLLLEHGILPVSALIVANLGSAPVITTMISLTAVHSLATCLSYPLAAASAIKLAQDLKNDDAERCRTFSRKIIVVSLVLAFVVSYCSYIFFHYLSFITTNDTDTVTRVQDLSMFMVPYSFCLASSTGVRGVLRVVNFTKEVVALAALCVWACGVSTGCYLCFVTRPTFELRGYFIGLLLGAALHSISFISVAIFIDWETEVARYAYLNERGDYSLSVDNPLSSLTSSLDGLSLGHTSLVIKGNKDLDDEMEVLWHTERSKALPPDTGIEMEDVSERGLGDSATGARTRARKHEKGRASASAHEDGESARNDDGYDDDENDNGDNDDGDDGTAEGEEEYDP